MAFAAPRTLTDAQGNQVSVVNDERGFVYTQGGWQVIFTEQNDDKALEQASMYTPTP